ncbi:alpha beta-hydrolase [Leucogyrophana mollusca]|uniref:Alpha beta-hydrolase n=1 Tax=Leucogyrophana mollusca TaxID=85980 RepID=A0ACB8BWL0_9AGAM|nr:alpha beta-hydrolase [Leucogyrophana mollusca]
MYIRLAILCLLKLAPLTSCWGEPGGSISGAGYDTSRVGPSNAVNVDINANETYLTKLFQDFISSYPYSSNFSDQYEDGTQVISDVYSISGTLCVPKTGEKDPGNVQYLIHGIGFDSSYWDFVVGSDEQYSYAYASAAAGIATFRYDRLGNGLSEKPKDAYNVVQQSTEVAIAIKFAEMLRDGSIGKYKKIVGVGHSYGSVQSQAVTAMAPDALDGVILTGYSANTTTLPYYLASAAPSTATLVFPGRFSPSDLPNAYLATLSPWTNQINFFYFPYYSQAANDRARMTEQPVTQGVLFTIGTNTKPATDFKGPVRVVTGDKDWIFCLNDCYAVPVGSSERNIPEFVKQLYPAASAFDTYIPANTGHALNQHYSAPETYQNMIQFAENVFQA